MDWTDIQQYSYMHFWLVIVERERSSAREQKEEEEGGAKRAEDSKVSGKVVHSTVPVSVCLPERHSPTMQRRRGTRGWKKKEMKRKWKTVGHKGGKTTTTQKEIQGNKETGSQVEESIVEKCVKKKDAAVRSLRKKCLQKVEKIKNQRVLEQRGKKLWAHKFKPKVKSPYSV